MPDSLAALTDKEKETLRLIVRGHDAKSAASELHLSVHTINERLRNARRKLDVTSSREAARLLLESEAQDPQELVSKQIGDASIADLPDNPQTRPRRRSARFWLGGFATMSLLVLVLSVTLAGSRPDTVSQSNEIPAAEVAAADAESERAARDWLELVDQADWQGSFDAAGSAFRAPNTVASWQAASEQALGPLGSVVSREAISFETVAAPPSGYQVVRFRTDFKNHDGVIESVTMERESGVLRVVGYFIN